MNVERIKKVAVIGAGTMGHGIAQVFAMAGYEVWMRDIAREVLDRAINRISSSLKKLYSKGVLKEAPEDVLKRIHTTLDVNEACKDADLVIEAVPEILDLKKKVFGEIDAVAPPHAILATNTSSLSITEIASATKRPEKVVGMHFFNPPVIMKLVEVVKGDKTSEDVVKIIMDLAKRLGKEPVLVKKDSPGFIVNRILFALFHEALWSLETGEYTIEEIDSAVRFKAGFPMGVFELIDYIGIDITYQIFKAMIERGVKFSIPPSFEKKANSKELGVKSGKGYYKYPAPGVFSKPSVSVKAGEKVDVIRLIAPAINEAATLLEEDVASKEDIDKAVKLGLNWPLGVFEYADLFGIDTVVSALNELKEIRKLEIFEPRKLLRDMVEREELGRKTGKGFYTYRVEEEKLETLLVKYEYPIAWIILNRPDKLNAMSTKMLDELREVLQKIDKNKDIRAVILLGNGKAFCAGADVSEFKDMTGVEALLYSRKIQGVFELIENLTKPVIAAIHGYALGGGLELALACDLRIAAAGSLLGQPEINLGIIPGAAATQKLVRLIGEGKAKEMIFLGDQISAEDALELGLVNKVVPKRELELEARRIALKLAEKPPLTIFIAKYVINYGKDVAETIGKAIESLGFGLARTTKDAEEGIKAFLEKRKPVFKGE
ncbi:MAG: 3-hydroxyacyl-CoA dehydrogenase/enoyl-CoA hydratase family protein [Candidatus Njordarchaeales archaeon]